MKILFRYCAVAVWCVFCGCGVSYAQQQIRIISEVRGLELEGSLEVELISTGDQSETGDHVDIAFHGVDKRRLSWHVGKDSTLRLSLRTGAFERQRYARVKVYCTDLRRIVSHGVKVEMDPESIISSPELTVYSSGGVNDINLNVATNSLMVTAIGDSHVELKGTAPYAYFVSKMGGIIDGKALESMDVTVSMVGGGEVIARPSDLLDANVSSGGTVYYFGTPFIKSKKSLGGKIIQVNDDSSSVEDVFEEVAPVSDEAVVVDELSEEDPL